jgi:hypothetical protein
MAKLKVIDTGTVGLSVVDFGEHRQPIPEGGDLGGYDVDEVGPWGIWSKGAVIGHSHFPEAGRRLPGADNPPADPPRDKP